MPKYEGFIDRSGNVEVRKTISSEDIAVGAVDVAGSIIGGSISLVGAFRQQRRDEKAQLAAQQLDWAIRASDQGNYHGAIQEINKVIQARPTDPSPYMVRAMVNLQHSAIAKEKALHEDQYRMIRAVIADANYVIRIDGDNFAVYWLRGSAHLLGRAYGDALADANICANLNPNDAPTHLLMSNIFLKLEDNEQALRSAQRALQIEANSSTYFSRGVVYFEMGEFQKALADFNRAVMLDRTNVQAREWQEKTNRKVGLDLAAPADPSTTAELSQFPADSPKEWPPSETHLEWCELTMNLQPTKMTYTIIAQARRNGRNHLIAYSPPLLSNTPTATTLDELSTLKNRLKQEGWEPVGKGSFWYSLRFTHAAT